MKTLLSVLVLSLVATPAVAQDQFDLVCIGKKRDFPSLRWNPREDRYRVDLARKVWCHGPCETVATIKAVSDAEITFAASDSPASMVLVIHHVNRIDGRWKFFVSGALDVEGQCVPAPYSGVPGAKF